MVHATGKTPKGSVTFVKENDILGVPSICLHTVSQYLSTHRLGSCGGKKNSACATENFLDPLFIDICESQWLSGSSR